MITKEQLIPKKYLEMSESAIKESIFTKKKEFGDSLTILAHHYQKDEIIPFADAVGDSLELAKIAQGNKKAKHIIFCGVHFMAETADMLTKSDQKVYLPDALAGCSMADMATRRQLEIGWEKLSPQFSEPIIPITYINSTAEVKAFVGDHGGVIVTSSNAETILKRILSQNHPVLFLPDQHLGRNTAYHLGVELDEMAVWNPKNEQLLNYDESAKLKVVLWQGRCCVHQQYSVKQIEELREKIPNLKVIVHPECPLEVVLASDLYGSTKKIVDEVANSPQGTYWAIGTDNNLVNRMIHNFSNHNIISIDSSAFSCITMNRIHLAHLLWTLDEIQLGKDTQRIRVDSRTTTSALQALDRMFAYG